MSKRKREEVVSGDLQPTLTEDIAIALFGLVAWNDVGMIILAIRLNTTSHLWVKTQLQTLAQNFIYLTNLTFVIPETFGLPIQRLFKMMLEMEEIYTGFPFTTLHDVLTPMDPIVLGRLMLGPLNYLQLRQELLFTNETHVGKNGHSPYELLKNGPQLTTNLWNVFHLKDKKYIRLFEDPDVAVCDNMPQRNAKYFHQHAKIYLSQKPTHYKSDEHFAMQCGNEHMNQHGKQIRSKFFDLTYEERSIKEAEMDDYFSDVLFYNERKERYYHIYRGNHIEYQASWYHVYVGTEEGANRTIPFYKQDESNMKRLNQWITEMLRWGREPSTQISQ